VVYTYSGLRQPTGPIPREIMRLTGELATTHYMLTKPYASSRHLGAADASLLAEGMSDDLGSADISYLFTIYEIYS